MKRITANLTRAFTLIELLIVVAIIAIITGSSMAVLTGPMFERLRAEDQQAFEAGAGIFFSTLVSDAHGAASLEFAGGNETGSTSVLTLKVAAPATGTIRYEIDNQGTLVRRVNDQVGAKLVPRVKTLMADKLTTGNLWAVSLTGELRGYDPITVTTTTRRMDVLVGQSSWTGGGAS